MAIATKSIGFCAKAHFILSCFQVFITNDWMIDVHQRRIGHTNQLEVRNFIAVRRLSIGNIQQILVIFEVRGNNFLQELDVLESPANNIRVKPIDLAVERVRPEYRHNAVAKLPKITALITDINNGFGLVIKIRALIISQVDGGAAVIERLPFSECGAAVNSFRIVFAEDDWQVDLSVLDCIAAHPLDGVEIEYNIHVDEKQYIIVRHVVGTCGPIERQPARKAAVEHDVVDAVFGIFVL